MLSSTVALLALTLLAAPAPGPPDQGMTSPVHAKHVGKVVFANAEVSKKAPDPAAFKRAFAWPEPIYARIYLPHSLAAEYAKQGWEAAAKPAYTMEIKVGGEVVWVRSNGLNPEWSSFQLGLVLAPGDTYLWPNRFAIPRALAQMKPGDNAVSITVFASKGQDRSKELASGGFTLKVDAAAIAKFKAALASLRGFKTTFRAGDDVWREWAIELGSADGKLKTTFRSGDDTWKEWRYEGPGGTATLKTTSRAGDDVWKEWRLERGRARVDIKVRFRSGDAAWADWVITSGKETWSAKPRFRSGDDAWKDWVVSGPGGKLEIKTRFRAGDDVWKDWVVTDNAPDASPDVKLAALFAVLYSGAIRHK
jgi:hypothetical protein